MTPTLSPPQNLDDPGLYINRELSWLEFNRRVLEEAQDSRVPLLERLKFLAIFSSNLDEFFMVRVGGLQQKVQAGITRSSGADRMAPQEQLDRISVTVAELVAEQYRCMRAEILPALTEKGIVIRGLKDLTPDERKHLRELFSRQFFPVLTPLAIDPGHPFPHLVNKSLNVAVLLRRPGDPDPLFAVVQVPGVLPRLVQLPDGGTGGTGVAFTPLETVIRLHLTDLFPGMELFETVCFRVTRDSEFELDEEVDDLLRAIEENVKQRRRGQAVRLEIEADGPPEVEQLLTAALDLSPQDVTRVPGLLDLTGLFQVHALPGFAELRDVAFAPVPVKEFATAVTPWAAVRAKDILVHHPYEPFKHVVDFIDAAADDDRVLAIKQTLYRTSSDSPVVKALQRAADRGKQVTAVIELKARLDEERNILWAKELEKSGVHVVFGFIGLKTHCKVALVVRRDEDGIRRYVHLATGNYNPQTARVYTDLGFFTANPSFADDVTLLFNYLTGYAELPQWRKLIVAPSRMQPFMIERIEREAANQRAGKKARLFAKLNGLLEPAVIQALYRASQAGVRIEIVCRGVCALRPGVPGVSDNIRVVSIVDRFLEHSRIFYFENAGDPEVFIGSADWMDRNLSRRVEVVFPVEQADLKARLIDEIIATSLADTAKTRELQADGSYRRLRPPEGQAPMRSQQRFLDLATESERRQATALIQGPPPTGSAPRPAPKVAKRRPRKPGGADLQR
ncbi:polyphosphate kinase 1 [Fimbriiglobus ruber]|uniref:Polyphosphate kinase n=1 Tax=Fimbriiglobus ruber TaxID=1908690 RepID=A0A225DE36_9BACT|nr:polyphosphate kinase 1 [Fimbriiglobus ruber]OWK34387.1 Polyphosphate kinase [Fimbriiglobus ruber]